MMRLLSNFGRTATGIRRVNSRRRGPQRPSAPLLFESLEARNLLTAGFLDPTFGTNGQVVTDFFGTVDVANDVALQSDGKTVVVGTVSGGFFSGDDFAVARYNVDGTLDTSFGGDGKVTTNFFLSQFLQASDDRANAVAIQSDGKIVVAGSTYYGGGYINFALVRYNTDGSLDAGFGNGGIVYEDFVGFKDVANDVAIQADGKIVVVGQATTDVLVGPNAEYHDVDFAIARYHPDGTLDATFDGDGKVLTNASPELSPFDYIHRVAIQPNGKIIVAGNVAADFSTFAFGYFGVARYNADGSIDSDFGIRRLSDGSSDSLTSLALQPDGKILLGGITVTERNIVARLYPDGTRDTTFDEDGIAQAGDFAVPVDLAVQPDGKVVVIDGFMLWRYHADGSLDFDFNFDGEALDVNGARAMAIAPDGKIVLVGIRNGDFVIARYLGDIEPTKFFVADRASDNTFQYDAQGDLVAAHDLAPGNNKPMGAAASHDGSRVWQVDENKRVYVYQSDGTILGDWKANGLSKPQGIATDSVVVRSSGGGRGTGSGLEIVQGDIWIVDKKEPKVLRYDLAAATLSGAVEPSFAFDLAHGNANPKGITTDGTTLWVVNDGKFLDKVYAYDTTGQLLHSWVIDADNSKPSGITIDPANVDHLWIVDADAKQILQYNHASGLQLGWQNANSSIDLHPGNVDPQGVADPSPWDPGAWDGQEIAPQLPDPTQPNPDVNRDGMVAPLDALLVMNHLNAFGSQTIGGAANEALRRLDVSGDLAITAIDALLVINDVNRSAAGEGESAMATAHAHQAAFVGSLPPDVVGFSNPTTLPSEGFWTTGETGPPSPWDGQQPAPQPRAPAPQPESSSANLPMVPGDEMTGLAESEDPIESLSHDLLWDVGNAWDMCLEPEGV